jgi:hypothetical protein
MPEHGELDPVWWFSAALCNAVFKNATISDKQASSFILPHNGSLSCTERLHLKLHFLQQQYVLQQRAKTQKHFQVQV